MNQIPTHVGIIMDGNGRWAKERGLKRSEGHKEGAKALERLALHAKKLGVKVLSVYAFSTDNFKRSAEEVDFLMNLLIYYFNEKLSSVCENNIKVVFSGRKEPLRDDVLQAMDNIAKRTENNNACILNICLNYGGQEEIVDATFKIADALRDGTLKREDLNRENRLSNFMLYQCFYAEILFSDTYFPDFLEKELEDAITYYQNRDRRFVNVKAD